MGRIGMKVDNDLQVNLEDMFDEYGISQTQTQLKELAKVSDDNDLNESKWTPEDEVRLICQVALQIPANDGIPYHERTELIQWEKITVGNRSVCETKLHFKEIIQRTRTFRLLQEIVAEVESNVFRTINIPLKYTSPFNLFLAESGNIEIITHERGIKQEEFLKECADKFLNLPLEEREEYKQRVRSKRAEYKAMIKNISADYKNKVKVGTPFELFYRGQKSRQGSSSYTRKDARKQFASLGHDEKLKWVLKSLNTTYGRKVDASNYQRAKQLLSKDEMAILDEYEGRPKKLSAYLLYMKEFFLNRKDTDCTAARMMKAVSKSWKDLSATAKAEYENKALVMKKKYDVQYKEFVDSLPADRRKLELGKRKIASKSAESTEFTSSKEITSLENDFKSRKHIKKDKSNSEFPYNDISAVENICEFDSKGSVKTKNKRKRKSTTSETIILDEITKEDSVLSKTKKKSNKSEPTNENRNVEKNLNKQVVSDQDSMYQDVSAVDNVCLLDSKGSVKTKNKRKSESTSSEKIIILNEDTKEDNALSKKKKKSNKSEPTVENINLEKLNKHVFSDQDSIYKDFENMNAHSTVYKAKKKKSKTVHEENSVELLSLATIQSQVEHNGSDFEGTSSITKPPSSVYEFYVKNLYNGEHSNAKDEYEALNDEDRDKVNRKFARATKRYLKSIKKCRENGESCLDV